MIEIEGGVVLYIENSRCSQENATRAKLMTTGSEVFISAKGDVVVGSTVP